MSKPITATYESGVFRPVEPVDLPEGTRVTLFVDPPDSGERPWNPEAAMALLARVHAIPPDAESRRRLQAGWDPSKAIDAVRRIASLPLERDESADSVAVEHDRYLDGDKSEFAKRDGE